MSQRNRGQRRDEEPPNFNVVFEIHNDNRATPEEAFLGRYQVVTRMRTVARVLLRLHDSIQLNIRESTPASEDDGFIRDFNTQADEHHNVALELGQLLFTKSPSPSRRTGAYREQRGRQLVRRIEELERNAEELQARWADLTRRRRSKKRLHSGEIKKEPKNEGPGQDENPREADV